MLSYATENPCHDLFNHLLDLDLADDLAAEDETEEVTYPETPGAIAMDTLQPLARAPWSRVKRLMTIRTLHRLRSRPRASLGFVSSPCCDDPGPHDDDGSWGSEARGFSCSACGLGFAL